MPVAAEEICKWFRTQVYELICLAPVEHLDGIGHWYTDFSQVTDQEVCELLRRATDPVDAQDE